MANHTVVQVMIGYKNDRGKEVIENNTHSKPSKRLQKRVKVVATSISSLDQLDLLTNDPDVDFIEEDVKVRLFGEIIPAGIAAIDAVDLPEPTVNSGACDDPSSFRVGVVDSGVDITHPDLPCYGNSNTCMGQPFGLQDGMEWSAPNDSHGM